MDLKKYIKGLSKKAPEKEPAHPYIPPKTPKTTRIPLCYLSAKEYEESNEFQKKHRDCCRRVLNKEFFSSTGGGFSYIVTPTGIGNCITIRCNSCGEEKDITDTSSW
jgi:hypothetical protein